MAATYKYAVKYEIHATCVTPLRTGNADNDKEAVLCDKNGTPFIQGNSISGALRSWLEQSDMAEYAEALFGSQQKQGHLVVSDGIFEEDTKRYLRPRLKIDGRTGSSENGKKFDIMNIGKDANLNFTIIWLGLEKNETEIEALEQMLSALDQGVIRLGANKSVGFGHVNLQVKKADFDLQREADRNYWLSDKAVGKPIKLPLLENNTCVTITVNGYADNLLVKSAIAKKQDDKSYIVNLMEGEYPILPGTSIKGAVRARTEAIATLLSVDKSITDEMFGRGADNNKEDETKNGIGGTVYFEDVYFDQCKCEPITRIRINRFTGGVMRNHLFTEEPLSSNVKFQIKVPEDSAYCMLLVYALRDLGFGLYNFGSGGSVGRGYISVKNIEIVTPDAKKAEILFSKDNQCEYKDSDQLLKNWSQVLEA